MINECLTDKERVQLAQKAYEGLNIGETVEIGQKAIGVLTRDVYAEDGMQAFLLENHTGPQIEITVLFKSSYGLKKGNVTTWRDEWMKTNLPIFVNMVTDSRAVPSQLLTAAKYLNRWLLEFPKSRFYIYGHSLGAINAQYALANCRHSGQIAGAYLYEGTNIWRMLDRRQRQMANHLRPKINAYVDIYDPVTLGYTATHKMVGRLHYIDSVQLKNPVKQHMWGGYRFDEHGRLLEKPVDAKFLLSSQRQGRFLSTTGELSALLSGRKKLAEAASPKWQQLKEDLFNSSFMKEFGDRYDNFEGKDGQ